MRLATDVLPREVSMPRLSARVWLALVAGVGCGVCAYAGLYPRFDDGGLRLVLALISAPFGAAVVAAATTARSAEAALVRAVLLSAVLGVAAVVLPAAILAKHSGEFFAGCIFGAFFGAPTGALYGLPLGALAALGFRHLHASTHEGNDRAARAGGLWLVGLSLLGLLGTLLFDVAKMDWATSTMSNPSRLPAALALAGALAGLTIVLSARRRMRRRAAWLERVRAGLEPTFRVRPLDARDDAEALPRISDGALLEVVEWRPDERGGAAVGAAYRAAAVGTALAVVSDERPLGSFAA